MCKCKPELTIENLRPAARLSKDVVKAAEILSDDEARYLVDAYYMMQSERIRAAHRVRTLTESGEPHEIISWVMDQNTTLENQIKRALARFVKSRQIGRWLTSITGIGPVISAGLIAHIDIKRAKTCGDIWNFAGLNPGIKWEKKSKRPWNAKLKTLCAFKLGESFVKVSNNPKAVYGHIYRARKDEYEKQNDAGGYKEQAATILTEKKFSKTTEAYKALTAGRLPQAQVHARARRIAVKLFLSHLFERWYELEFGKRPERPYAQAILNHGHYIEPPAMVD